MKRTKLFKLFTVILAVYMALSSATVFPVSAANLPGGGVSSPMNVAIISQSIEFGINDVGLTYCYGATETTPKYKAEVVVELQQKGSTWHTIETWKSTDASGYAYIIETPFVDEGYTYRLKMTNRAYNVNNQLVETLQAYSKVYSY